MEATIQTPPRTIMEVYKMLPEGTLAELIDNVIYMSPAPTPEHQSRSLKLASRLLHFLEEKDLGTVFCAPIDVFLDKTSNAVQPDIIIVLKDQLHIIHEKGHIHGVPAILIEILSAGNKSHDLILKKDLYERFGVPEYHIVDPSTKLVLSFSLSGGSYGEANEEIGRLFSPLLAQEFLF